jgi:diguanylate cyclase (GGDEF)-like protein
MALLGSDRSLDRLLGSWSKNSLEFATLVVGVFTALALASFPWAAVLALLPLSTLHRGVLVQQLEHAATVDTKTGLLNAGTWQSLASVELERARRHSNNLGVLMIDIDHFKAVNHRYNHLVGDHALRATAKVLRNTVRGYDLVGRFGGDEFVILLVGTGHAGSVEIANRICERIRTLRIEDAITRAAYRDLHLSVSVGVATYPDTGMTLDEVLMAADNAVFAAKDAGRDQVVAIQMEYTDDHRSAPGWPTDEADLPRRR